VKKPNPNIETSNKNILLTGVFGPFAQDDEYGSRTVNPMELYHNQVTRVQGPFSLRMFHRTLGLMMIEANINAPCTILDFPTQDRFMREIATRRYDVIGISAIVPNVGKVMKMCEEIRRHQPEATIVVGGHIASMEDAASRFDADHICKGDGIRWFREYLNQDVDAPILHPSAISGFGTRILGISVNDSDNAAVLIPSVGCPVGCNFCSTSSLFGGKGHNLNFYETGEEIFSVLLHLEKKLKVDSFFVLDENFLLYRNRSLRLLELMEEHNKSWTFYVFSSARVLQSYTIDQLVRIGIGWVWLGLEGKDSKYSKLNGVDTLELVRNFQSQGIRVLGSTIIGMEEHTPENIHDAIDYAVLHNTDFHQFMLYTPMPGTPLYREHQTNGTLLSEEECPIPDIHGQVRFSYLHPHIRNGREGEYLLKAFQKDFDVNGPSLARIVKTTLTGWKRYKNHPDKRIIRRYKAGISGFRTVYPGAIWAMAKWYRNNPEMRKLTTEILHDFYKEFGLLARLTGPVVGRYLHFTMKREAKKLDRGWTYEPPMIYEKNQMAIQLDKKENDLSCEKVRKILLPAYDLNSVVSSYRQKIEDAKHQLEEIKIAAVDDMSQMMVSISEKRRQTWDQLQNFKVGLKEKRLQTGEQVLQICEKFKEQCALDRAEMTRVYEQMIARCEEVSEELDQVRETMKARYEAARSQIDVMTDQIAEKYQHARQQIDQAFDLARQQIASLDNRIEALEKS